MFCGAYNSSRSNRANKDKFNNLHDLLLAILIIFRIYGLYLKVFVLNEFYQLRLPAYILKQLAGTKQIIHIVIEPFPD